MRTNLSVNSILAVIYVNNKINMFVLLYIDI